ncbi:MAG: GatB/YqeY domain-containing protein [Gammaproteobacteria bacterium]|nr:GatB/YqeY domain-containing protein [Gammaproteobacteria bacterium]
MALKATIQEDMKAAMRSGDKTRLGVIRMLLAAIQVKEIEARAALADSDVLAVVEKLIKQRQDSAQQFAAAGRDDRAAAEQAEAGILQAYLPEQLSDAEVAQLVADAIKEAGATSMRDMGKVMASLRPATQGRADMGLVSGLVKTQLSGNA